MNENIRNFILNGGDFNATALELWRFQVKNSVNYGRFCGSVTPNSWKNIPAVPVALFRDVTFTTFPPFMAQQTFRTSGTTGKRGQHILQNTEIYDLGSTLHMHNVIGGVPKSGLSLVSPAVDSSLGHMCRSFAPQMRQGFDLDVGVRREFCWTYLENVKEAIFFPGTAFAFDALVSGRVEPCPLPDGSVIMVTGGYKGRTANLDSEDLATALKRIFVGAKIVGEYGMTELSSQLWSPSLDSHFVPPHWMKVIAVDPFTGHETNGRGQLRFFDLANHQSVMAIETRDEGIVHQDGSLTLFGRLPDAPARGCSLTVEAVDRHFKMTQVIQSHRPPYERQPYKSHKRPLAIEPVCRALSKLQTHPNLTTWTQGISVENAMWGLKHCLQSINQSGLKQCLNGGVRPSRVTVVTSYGVCVSGLEWIALAAASGAKTTIKAPKYGAQIYTDFARALSEEGLNVSCTTAYELGSPDWIIAFGSDETIQALHQRYPDTPIQSYGHRFSFAVVDALRCDIKALARNILAYDTRGCMAPVACFILNHSTNFDIALAEALHADTLRYPPGSQESLLGPELRRRQGLARILGSQITQSGFELLNLPSPCFFPSALPRTAVIHPIKNTSELHATVEPWNAQISSIGWDLSEECPYFNCRVVPVSELQRPGFPRKHDGTDMWCQA